MNFQKAWKAARPFNPRQDPYEAKWFWGLIQERKASSLLEIGTLHGGNLVLMSLAMPDNSKIVCVDNGTSSRWRPEGLKLALKFVSEKHSVRFVNADSQNQDTADLVAGTYDLIFIDGAHRKSKVQRDWDLYGPMCAADGMVGFHDVAHRGLGTEEFWKEILELNKYDVDSCVRETGLGVIFGGKKELHHGR